jgi:large subunit ribosomal protein L10
MKLTKDQKKDASKKLADAIGRSPFLCFTAYQGLKFQELDELRKKLKPMRCKYRIVKNSTLGHALKHAGLEAADPKLLDGPNAILIAEIDDPVGPSKILVQFMKDCPSLKLKAALVGAKWMSAADCERLSKIGTRPELLGKLVGALYSTVSQSAGVLAAPVRDLVLVLRALEEQKKTVAPAKG